MTFFSQHYLPEIRSGKIRPEDIQPKRITVNITSPLYSLKFSAMHVIRKTLKDSNKVCHLEIPKQLQHDLIVLMKTFRI